MTPYKFSCLIASVNLTALPRTRAMPDAECEGDIIHYNCSIATNGEYLNLVWQLTPSNEDDPLSLLLDQSSQLGTEYILADGITVVLHYYDTSQGSAHSEISLIIQQGFVSNGTRLGCGVELDNGEIVIVTDNLTVGGL